jgi:hypothetical protein
MGPHLSQVWPPVFNSLVPSGCTILVWFVCGILIITVSTKKTLHCCHCPIFSSTICPQ